MKKIRIGMTGSGFMAQTHAEAIKRLSDRAVFTAVWGGSRAPGLAQKYGAVCDKSAAALAKRADVDAIIITTPHAQHIEEVMLALEAGKHVLVEKPMATNVADCDRMLEGARKRGLVIAVGYNSRFRDNPICAKKLITENRIGSIRSMQFTMILDLGKFEGGGFGHGKPWLDKAENIGFVVDGLPHGIDTMCWLTGAKITKVAGFSRTFLPRPVEDTTVGIVELSNGAVCSVTTSCAAAGDHPTEGEHMLIVGSEGILDMDNFGKLYMTDRAEGWRLINTQAKIDWANAEAAFLDVRMKAYKAQMASFLDGIEGKPMEMGSGAEGRAGLAACLAMLESSRDGKIIHFS